MHEILVAVRATLLIAGPGIQHLAMGQHAALLVRQIQQVAVALQALVVFDVPGGLGPAFRVIVVGLVLDEMGHDILEAVQRLGEEKVKGIVGRGQVAVHAVGHHAPGIVGVRGRAPGIVGVLYLVAGSTKKRCRGPYHGIIGETEKREGYCYSEANEQKWLSDPFHAPTSQPVPSTLVYNLRKHQPQDPG